MRKPSEYLPAAVAGLRSRLMPDCSDTLVCDGRSASVTRVGSPSRGEDPLTDTDVQEGVRVLALASDFPGLSKGRLVSLGGRTRLVTSARTDPAGATLSIGLSAEMERCPAAYSRGRLFRYPLEVLALESAVIPSPYEDAAAPSYDQTWIVAIPAELWPDVTAPQVGDAVELSSERLDAPALKVSSVVQSGGCWLLHARPRGGV